MHRVEAATQHCLTTSCRPPILVTLGRGPLRWREGPGAASRRGAPREHGPGFSAASLSFGMRHQRGGVSLVAALRCTCANPPERFISSLITKISEKHDLQQSTVANYIRTKISFDLIRSQVMCIRGSRKRRKIEIEAQEIEVVESLSRCQRD